MTKAPVLTKDMLSDLEAGADVARLLATSGGVARDAEDERVWYLGSYDRVAAAFSDPALVRERPGQPVPDNPAGRRPSPGLVELDQTWAVFRDPPAHTHLRKALAGALAGLPSPDMQRHIEGRISALVGNLRSQGSFDAARDLAPLVPVIAMAAMMGFFGDVAHLFETHAAAMLRPGISHTSFLSARVALVNLLADTLAQRPENADGGLLFRLRALMPDASLPQVLSAAVFLITTGHGGVRDAISSALWLAATNRDDGAIGDSARTGATLMPVFQETIRFYPPLRMVDRWLAKDCPWAPAEMRRGDRVFLLIGAASRDPDAYPEPDRFDVKRAAGRRLAFGAGPHTCLGQSLAPWLWASVLRPLFSDGWACEVSGTAIWSDRPDESRLISLPLQYRAGMG